MYTFHRAVYAVLRALIRIWFAVSGQYRCETYTPRSKTSLILTNHNTNWDFFYFGAPFRGHMYFVASEHIFRSGLVSRIIKFLVDPIARKKGASSIGTIREIQRRLKKGQNVCMMAEGNRSFSGRTGFISPATASLVKSCGAGLITFRIHGGYFVNPRWSRKTRKGPVWGEVAGQYTAEELRAMTSKEVYDILNRDLFVDAFEDQREKQYSYKTASPAETLETALFACPDCGSFASLKSIGDRIVCENCGSEHILSDKGFFERADGTAPAFDDVYEWSEWQKTALKEYILSAPAGSLIRSDEGARLYSVHPLSGKELAAEGTLSLYKDRLEIRGADGPIVSFPVTSINNMAVILVNTILFSHGDGYYQLSLPDRASALHYLISYYYLNGKEYEK